MNQFSRIETSYMSEAGFKRYPLFITNYKKLKDTGRFEFTYIQLIRVH